MTIDKLYDSWSLYSTSGTVWFLGDFNAHNAPSSTRTHDLIVCKCLADIDIFAVNTLPTCTGANHSYVSYDDIYHTMIDCICIPAGVLPCVCTREIVDDNCLNVSRHRPVLVNLVLPSIQTNDVVTNGTQANMLKHTRLCYILIVILLP